MATNATAWVVKGYDYMLDEIYDGPIYTNEDLARSHLRSREWLEPYRAE